MQSLPFESGNHTDVGLRRQANEDYYGNWALPGGGHLFVVCDGMGGHVGGAEASRLAVEAIHSYFAAAPVSNPVVSLQKGLEAANTAIATRKQAQPELSGMGTTAVAVLIWNNKAWYAHLGDSRIYHQRNGVLHRLTKDHSFVQTLVDSGNLTEEEAEQHPRKNEIYKALGIHPEIDPDICSEGLSPADGDYLLLCTDGLTGMVPEREIRDIIADAALSVQQKAGVLIDRANAAGGVDNSTVQLICFDRSGPGGNPHRKGRRSTTWPLLALLPVGALAGWWGYQHFRAPVPAPAVTHAPGGRVTKSDTGNALPPAKGDSLKHNGTGRAAADGVPGPDYQDADATHPDSQLVTADPRTQQGHGAGKGPAAAPKKKLHHHAAPEVKAGSGEPGGKGNNNPVK